MNTPVAFFIYRRPDPTAQVFERIAQAKPSRLLVVSDGPKNGSEKVLVEKCRDIATRVNWPCEVEINFSDTNMGCRNRVASGLDWVFERCEEAIILEDDVLVDPSFFPFCDAMLDRYRDTPEVMQISAMNNIGEWKSDMQSYHFSYSGAHWGWATWRRAWDLYDVNMELWAEPSIKAQLRDFIPDEHDFKLTCQVFDETYSKRNDTWDYQWSFAQFIRQGLSLIPSRNLVTNIGFGNDGTHVRKRDWRANQKSYPLKEPFVGPDEMQADKEYMRAVRVYERKMAPTPSLARRALNRAIRALKSRVKPSHISLSNNL